MKQNSQWLSQVRTRSKTADDTSAPSGSPGSLATWMVKGSRRPRRRTTRSRSGSSTSRLYSMTSRGDRPLSERSSSPGRSPDRSAGDDSVTATTLGAVVTRGADILSGYPVPPPIPPRGARYAPELLRAGEGYSAGPGAADGSTGHGAHIGRGQRGPTARAGRGRRYRLRRPGGGRRLPGLGVGGHRCGDGTRRRGGPGPVPVRHRPRVDPLAPVPPSPSTWRWPSKPVGRCCATSRSARRSGRPWPWRGRPRRPGWSTW